MLGLRFCARVFSSCGKRWPLFIAVRGPLTIAAPPAAEHRLQTRRLSIVAHGPSCSAARGIFPDQGSNLRPLHRQADSQPLRHQGSPLYEFYWEFLIINGCSILSNAFPAFFEMIIWFLSFLLLMWCITLITLWMLNHPYIPGINPTWSWCVILLIYCCIWFANILLMIFAPMFIRYIGL